MRPKTEDIKSGEPIECHGCLYKQGEIKVLKGAIKKASKDFNGMRWGYDGDCGSNFIIDELEEALKGEG